MAFPAFLFDSVFVATWKSNPIVNNAKCKDNHENLPKKIIQQQQSLSVPNKLG
uniref:Uncharacterized protein n=1 Tax=Arundo donax TaxID=35708 RepID=A0A0A9GB83_ARUDO